MNQDRSGIDSLRAAIDDVATQIEQGEPARPRTRRAWSLGFAAAAAVILIALLIGTWGTWTLRPPAETETSEVKVLVLKINGRDVRARIVEDSAPATIIVMPQPNGETPPAAASIFVGGSR
jgi:hypothetical protein